MTVVCRTAAPDLACLQAFWQRFVTVCTTMHLKPLCILEPCRMLERGSGGGQLQFQTARYAVFSSVAAAERQAHDTKRALSAALPEGAVVRVRVETLASSSACFVVAAGETGETGKTPYFETHLRIRPPPGASREAMRAFLRERPLDVLEPHLSFQGGGGGQRAYLNARGGYGGSCSREVFAARWAELKRDVEAAFPGTLLPDKHEHREWAVCDDNVGMDDDADSPCVVPAALWAAIMDVDWIAASTPKL